LLIATSLSSSLWFVFQCFLVLLLPSILFAVVIHVLERLIQLRMAKRFGWKSVLWTGWLGTPIHELSHALMCVVFRHRIEEMALFEPDFESGRLGYVRHSYRPGSWFQEIGNVFIGIAPLAGGALALLLSLRIFFPGAISESIAAAAEQSQLTAQVYTIASTILGKVLFSGLARWETWVFIYLTLCIGSHMAPSWSDYQGAKKGAILLAIILLTVTFLIGLLVPDSTQIASLAAPWMAPLLAVYSLVIVLCLAATIVVFTLTAIWDALPFS